MWPFYLCSRIILNVYFSCDCIGLYAIIYNSYTMLV
nr:MAG TPA: hypothetical protein [Caudoviricetes sp.]